MSIKAFKNKNAIAYDESLRDKLKQLHNMLGAEITDVAAGAFDYGQNFNPEAKQVLKTLSSIASDLSVVLLNARKKKTLSKEEQRDFDNVKNLTESLGNLQFKLNKIIQKAEEFKKIAQDLREMGMDCSNYIMDTQEQFRMVRANINDFSYMSVDPEIAYQYKEELAKEDR